MKLPNVPNVPNASGGRSRFASSGLVAAAVVALGSIGTACAAAGDAPADAPGMLMIGGVQGSSVNSYAYVGLIRPMRGATPGHGFFWRGVASWLTYRYDTRPAGAAADIEVKASAPGIDGGAGWAWDDGSFSGDVSLAAGVRHTSLSPDVEPGRRPTRLTVTPQLALRYRFSGRIDADAIGAVSSGTRDSFARARLGAEPISGWRAGVEAVVASGPNYRNVNRGLFAGTGVARGWWIEVNAGRTTPQGGQPPSTYAGVSVSLLR